jgi:queuine tRNA-ribosyltransferase
LDERSAAAAGRDWSRAYLHHLTKAGEILGMMMLTAINIAYYQELMAELRAAIAAGRFDDTVAKIKEDWARGEAEARTS